MSEQSEKKNPARAAAMAKVWAGRRAWGMAPTCCCGCDQRLEIAKTPERQKYFKPGHDTALKSLLRKVLSGSVPARKFLRRRERTWRALNSSRQPRSSSGCLQTQDRKQSASVSRRKPRGDRSPEASQESNPIRSPAGRDRTGIDVHR